MAALFRVIEVSAITLPWKAVVESSVAELPTCQYTLQAEAPLIRRTELADAVVSVDPISKTNWANGVALGVERHGAGELRGGGEPVGARGEHEAAEVLAR